MRKDFLALTFAGLLVGGCAGTNTTLTKELGPTPQEQILALKAEHARCDEYGRRVAQERDQLAVELASARQELQATRDAVTASERARLEAEQRIEALRRDMAQQAVKPATRR